MHAFLGQPDTCLACSYLTEPALSAYDGLLREFYGCLARLGLGYVDCLLIHWPGNPSNSIGPTAARAKRREMWAAMEKIYELGLRFARTRIS